jgi:hypothetical protein
MLARSELGMVRVAATNLTGRTQAAQRAFTPGSRGPLLELERCQGAS